MMVNGGVPLFQFNNPPFVVISGDKSFSFRVKDVNFDFSPVICLEQQLFRHHMFVEAFKNSYKKILKSVRYPILSGSLWVSSFSLPKYTFHKEHQSFLYSKYLGYGPLYYNKNILMLWKTYFYLNDTHYYLQKSFLVEHSLESLYLFANFYKHLYILQTFSCLGLVCQN